MRKVITFNHVVPLAPCGNCKRGLCIYKTTHDLEGHDLSFLIATKNGGCWLLELKENFASPIFGAVSVELMVA